MILRDVIGWQRGLLSTSLAVVYFSFVFLKKLFCVLKSESAGVVREFDVIFMSVDNEVVFEFFCLFLCTWV